MSSPPFDFLPDLAVGRLPVNDEQQFRVLYDKMSRFEAQGTEDWWQRATFVADDGEIDDGTSGIPPELSLGAFDFPARQRRAAELVAPILEIEQIALEEGDVNASAARAALLAAFDDGRRFISFMGHASRKQWAAVPLSNALLHSDDVSSLNNTNLPLVFAFAEVCARVMDSEEGLGEQLVRQPDAGAAGVFANYCFAPHLVSYRVQIGMLDALANARRVIGTNEAGMVFESAPVERIGEAILNGLRWSQLQGTVVTLHNWAWLGDPALRFESLPPAVEIHDLLGPVDPLQTQWQGRAGLRYRLLAGEDLDRIDMPVAGSERCGRAAGT